jgi:hypothetical protein
MSPADFATSFTLSIARPVRLFCCAGFCGGGLARSVAATVPTVGAVVVCGGAALAVSDLAASALTLSESVACCAICACAIGVSVTHAATAATANHVFRQKGS